jgi:Electron transfer DM13
MARSGSLAISSSIALSLVKTKKEKLATPRAKARGLLARKENMISKLGPLVRRSSVIVAVLVVLAFLWWTLSPLFINKRVSETVIAEVIEEEQAQPQTTMTLLKGSFQSADSFHQVSGTVRVIDREEDVIVRLEDDFNSINGPDLRVWLVKGEDRDNALDLGALRGNIGSQNYVLPEGTTLSNYDRVLIWCRAFRTLFGSAVLSQAQGNSEQ